MFEDWSAEHKHHGQCDAKFLAMDVNLLKMSEEDLVYVLTRFILEVKKKTSAEYPLETLYELLICLQLYMFINGRKVKLLDDFVDVHNCLDNCMKELSRDGNVHPHNQAVPIRSSIDPENEMWKQNILGSSNPKQLVDTILYLFGVHFALCVGLNTTL